MSAAYLEFITSVLGVPLFYVRGNHDEMYDQEPPGGIDLHRKVVEFEGLTFAGIEGSIRYNQGSIQYDDWQDGANSSGHCSGSGGGPRC